MIQTKEQEKARELISEFFDYTQDQESAKECAIFMVDMIIREYEDTVPFVYETTGFDLLDSYLDSWKEVKEEIKKL